MSTSVHDALRTAFQSVHYRYSKAWNDGHREIFDESYFGHRVYEAMAPTFKKTLKWHDLLKWQDECCGFRVDLHLPTRFVAELKWIRLTGSKMGDMCPSSAQSIGRCADDLFRLAQIHLHQNIECWFILGGDREAFRDMFRHGMHRTKKGFWRQLGNEHYSPLARLLFPFEPGRVELKKYYQDSKFSPVFVHTKTPLGQNKDSFPRLPAVIYCEPNWYQDGTPWTESKLERRIPDDLGADNFPFCFCAWRISTNGAETFSAG